MATKWECVLMLDLLWALVVLGGVAATDYLWARYILALTDHRRMQAATVSAVLQGLSGLVTIAYVGNQWLIIAATIGAFVGTWLAMRRAL
jgi:hypothetical protein